MRNVNQPGGKFQAQDIIKLHLFHFRFCQPEFLDGRRQTSILGFMNSSNHEPTYLFSYRAL